MNFAQGFDTKTATELTVEVIKELKNAGKTIDENQIASIIEDIMKTDIPEEKKEKYVELLNMIEELPKFGNDIEEVDQLARDVAYSYTRPLEKFKNPRGGMFQAQIFTVV